MNKLLKQVASVACALLVMECASAAPSLEIPVESEDATFVVGVDWSATSKLDSQHIELYRNYQGGEFELIAVGQSIQALSQVVLKNGVYGYKLRLQSGHSSVETETSYVEVDSPVLRYTLPEPNERRSYSLGMNR